MVHSKEKPFACHLCDYRTSVASYLSPHVKRVHGDRLFNCPHPGCQYSSSRQGNVTVHLSGVHGTEKPFLCDHPGCNFRSNRSDTVSMHKRQIHSSDRPFVGNYTGCAYSSNNKSNLIKHKKQVHLKMRSECCHSCNMSFSHKSNLRSHMLSIHAKEGHEIANCENCAAHLNQRNIGYRTSNERTKEVRAADVTCVKADQSND